MDNARVQHGEALNGGVPTWQALVEPAAVFAHPSEVLEADGLSRERKRAILASWASDAWAVESAPTLRHCPGGGRPVRLDDVLAALRSLDGIEGESTIGSHEAPRRRQGLGRRALLGCIRSLRPRRVADLN